MAKLTIEEAIEFLQRRIDLIKTEYPDRRYALEDYRKVLEISVEAMEKQVPKKPKNMKTIFDFSGRYYSTDGECPVCGAEVLSRSSVYCNKCGQKLDWN